MTTILFYIFVFVWVSFASFFIYLFVKHDYDLTAVKESIFKPKENKIINKSLDDIINTTEVKTNKNTTSEMLEGYEKEVKEELPIEEVIVKKEGDCEHPGGLLLNICDKKEYSEEERILRGKILDRLKATPTYFHEDGMDKLIVPLEIMVFLNNDLNPLVSENGEIILALENKQTEALLIKDKETGDTLFKSEKEQEEAIQALKELSKELNVPVEDLASSFKEKYEERTQPKEESESKDKVNTKKEIEPNKEPNKEDNKETEPKKEIETIKEDNKETEPSVLNQEGLDSDLIEDLLEDNEIPEIKIDTGLLEDSLEDELSELITQDKLEEKSEVKEDLVEEAEDENIKDFLHNKKWMEGEDMTINWKEITDNVVGSFSNQNNRNAFLNNIIKQAPLITNDNKTAIFIDLKIINNSFARLFGNDSEVLIKKLMRMPMKISDSYKKGLEISLEENISDLSTDTKRFSTSYFIKNDQSFKAVGLWLQMDTFKQILNEDEFDFFRHYIYNEGFKLGVQNKNAKPLIYDINGTVI